MDQQTSDFLIRLGQHIKQHRTSTGMSQESFCKLCGLDRTYISSVENGRRNVSVVALHAMAIALDITLANLLDVPAQV